jgi:membrane protease YdiL (CAAX protease family)
VALYYLPFGIVIPALSIGWLKSMDTHRTVSPLSSTRDFIGVPVAAALGTAVALFPLGSLLSNSEGQQHLHRLFALLLVASLAEVMIFLGMIGNAVLLCCDAAGLGKLSSRTIVIGVSSVLFGLFHFTYPAPWNTGQTAMLLSFLWLAVALLYVATGSLLGAIALNNTLALVGFVKRDLTIPGTATEGWLRALVAFALAMLLVAVVQRWLAARQRSTSVQV